MHIVSVSWSLRSDPSVKVINGVVAYSCYGSIATLSVVHMWNTSSLRLCSILEPSDRLLDCLRQSGAIKAVLRSSVLTVALTDVEEWSREGLHSLV